MCLADLKADLESLSVDPKSVNMQILANTLQGVIFARQRFKRIIYSLFSRLEIPVLLYYASGRNENFLILCQHMMKLFVLL